MSARLDSQALAINREPQWARYATEPDAIWNVRASFSTKGAYQAPLVCKRVAYMLSRLCETLVLEPGAAETVHL